MKLFLKYISLIKVLLSLILFYIYYHIIVLIKKNIVNKIPCLLTNLFSLRKLIIFLKKKKQNKLGERTGKKNAKINFLMPQRQRKNKS